VIASLLGILILLIVVDVSIEWDKIAVDRYNFEQLEKIRIVLKGNLRENYKFGDINEFNKMYSQDIKPIKNCYFLVSEDSGEKFMF
jgi:hypothetical protein